LPTDNKIEVNRVYGTVNIKIEPSKLQKVKKSGKKQKQFDKIRRKKVESVSQLVHTYIESGKVRGYFFYKETSSVIVCPELDCQ
jgi:hypothetical protein